jgi:anti-sigma regulatory factor (Ser/Thr protein kinase)
VDALVLAADEVCANVVAHGYAGRAPGPLMIEVAPGTDARGAAAVLVTVCDEAPPFDPAEAPAPPLDGSLEARPVGGLGWHLVRASVDEVRYARDGARNVVTLVRRLAPAP